MHAMISYIYNPFTNTVVPQPSFHVSMLGSMLRYRCEKGANHTRTGFWPRISCIATANSAHSTPGTRDTVTKLEIATVSSNCYISNNHPGDFGDLRPELPHAPSIGHCDASDHRIAISTSYQSPPHSSVAKPHNHVYLYGKDGAAAGVHVQLCAATTKPRQLAHLANCPGLEHPSSTARDKARNRRSQLRRRCLRR
jgi:hypothetical protein